MTPTYRLPLGRATAPNASRASRPCLVRCAARAVAAALTVVVVGCAGSPSESAYADQLAVGTWGGDGAGLMASDTVVHVHIGCTNGNFRRPLSLEDGRFNVAGTYILRAFPIPLGPELPARFTGVVRGRLLTLAVAVDDTVEKRLVALGPVTVVYGQEPRLAPCPICLTPMRPWAGALQPGWLSPAGGRRAPRERPAHAH